MVGRKQRDDLIAAYYAAKQKTTWPFLSTLSSEERRAAYGAADRHFAAYLGLLRPTPISRCPFTGELLEFAFDSDGLDGPWWASSLHASATVVTGPPTFKLLLGAVDLHGRDLEPEERRHALSLGPGLPYIHERMASTEGTAVVVSQQSLDRNDTVYFIAYFNPDPSLSLGTAFWPRLHVAFTHQSNLEPEAWDFDLQQWIERGSLRWIVPGDTDFALQQAGGCPWVGKEGIRSPQVFASEWKRQCRLRGEALGIIDGSSRSKTP